MCGHGVAALGLWRAWFYLYLLLLPAAPWCERTPITVSVPFRLWGGECWGSSLEDRAGEHGVSYRMCSVGSLSVLLVRIKTWGFFSQSYFSFLSEGASQWFGELLPMRLKFHPPVGRGGGRERQCYCSALRLKKFQRTQPPIVYSLYKLTLHSSIPSPGHGVQPLTVAMVCRGRVGEAR